MRLVLDASVVVKWFVIEDGHDAALRLFDLGGEWHAPSLLPLEVANVLWRKVRRGEYTAAAAKAAVQRLRLLPIHDTPLEQVLPAALDLALQLDHPVYDCCYLVVAQEVGARLVTADHRLIARVRGMVVEAKVVALDAV